MDILKEVARIWHHLFAILGVLFLGYVLVEGEAYLALTVLAFMVGLGFWLRLSRG